MARNRWARNGWLARCACALVALCAATAGARGDIGSYYGNWSNYGTWGYCNTSAYGQTFVGNGEICTGFRFRFYSESCCSSWPFRAVLMRWDGANSRAIGPVLAEVDSSFGNNGCCWFDREVVFPATAPTEQGLEYVVFFTVTPWWGSYGCPNASFAITPSHAYQQGEMVVLGSGSSSASWTESTWGRPGYDLEFVVRTTNDCDASGIPDATEIADGTLADCDGNGFADICEQLAPGTESLVGGERGPVGSTASVSYSFDSVLPSRGDVQLRIDATGDLSATHEFLLVAVGGGPAHPIFTGALADCVWQTQTITIPRDEYNAAIVKNAVQVTVSASPTVDVAACAGLSAVTVQLDYTEAFPDCNGNLVADSGDFCSGVSLDCNGNRRPDECDIAAGSSNDIDADGVPDECQPDCNHDGRPDAFQIFVGEEPDCNANALPDECDLYTGGVSIDCNGNGTPDECDIASGFAPDCDADGKIDSCALAQGLVPDCNANGVPDSCDLSTGFAQDCDHDGRPDSCNLAGTWSATQRQEPFNYSDALVMDFNDAVQWAKPTEIYVNYYACTYGYYGYYMRITVDGTEIASWHDYYWGTCTSNTRQYAIPASVWSAAAADGVVQIRVHASGWNATSGSFCEARVLMQAKDCNSNGIPDECDISSGFDHDCNANGRLDGCDITAGAEDDNANGYPDPCELDRGDLNLDGIVGGADLAIMLSYWGGVGYPIGDCNHDGIIEGADLAILLSNWAMPL